MRILITAGPTREPIDPVRYIGNRSSGRVGLAVADAARRRGHFVSLILGPVSVMVPEHFKRTDVETADQMRAAVLEQFPSHDLLIMAAAVADYRPKSVRHEKMERGGTLTIELEATTDILAAAGAMKRPDQRTVGFSLVSPTNLERSIEKLNRKHLDLIVSNPMSTMNGDEITPIFLWPDGRREDLVARSKATFADELIERAIDLFN